MKVLLLLTFALGLITFQLEAATYDQVKQHFNSLEENKTLNISREHKESFTLVDSFYKLDQNKNYSISKLLKKIYNKTYDFQGLSKKDKAFILHIFEVLSAELMKITNKQLMTLLQQEINVYFKAIDDGKVEVPKQSSEAGKAHTLPGLDEETIGLDAEGIYKDHFCALQEDLKQNKVSIRGSHLTQVVNNIAYTLNRDELDSVVNGDDKDFFDYINLYFQGAMGLYVTSSALRARINIEGYAKHQRIPFSFQ